MAKTEGLIIVIDDEEQIRDRLQEMVSIRCRCEVMTFEDGRDAYSVIAQGGVAVVLLDWVMPYSGAHVLHDIKDLAPETKVIVMTAHSDVETAVEVMKAGANDFITKPFDTERMKVVIQSSLETYELKRDYRLLREQMMSYIVDPSLVGIVFRSSKIKSLLLVIGGLSMSRHPVLITGETGVGKEVFAKAVHNGSGLKGPFVAVNAAGLDDVAFSDTLFGHKKGAFTGADSNRDGLVKQAEGGTLFLDEIGDLSAESQIKLLRFVQEGEYYRLGSDAIQKSDVRIVTATNIDLSCDKKFRRDLYFRLNTHTIPVPPLRERMEDVPLLFKHFIEKTAADIGKKTPEVPGHLLYALQGYSFPGNVRELENIANNMVILNRDGVLRTKDLPFSVPTCNMTVGLGDAEIGQIELHPLSSFFGKFPTIDEMENFMIQEVLRITDNNQSAAARILGMSRPTLCKRLKNC